MDSFNIGIANYDDCEAVDMHQSYKTRLHVDYLNKLQFTHFNNIFNGPIKIPLK